MSFKYKRKKTTSLLILGLIWLAGFFCDRIWFSLDRSIPAWDQADYLTGSLNYWQALQDPQWLNGEWWQSFWLLSSKIPPLTYVATAIVQNIFGTGFDQATLINLFFNAILLGSVYGLGTILFAESVGLWAAVLCQIMPALYRYRLEFLLDFPLTAVVSLCFFCLTAWHLATDNHLGFGNDSGSSNSQSDNSRSDNLQSYNLQSYKSQPETLKSKNPKSKNSKSGNSKSKNLKSKNTKHPTSKPRTPKSIIHSSLFWLVSFGLSFGLALMVKQTTLIFMFTPLFCLGVGSLIRHRWGKLLQLIISLGLSALVFAPWYRTNWLLILTSGKRATVDSAIAEGDAPLNTLGAWIFYLQQLPYQVSLPLLLIPTVVLLLYWTIVVKIKNKNLKLTKLSSDNSEPKNLDIEDLNSNRFNPQLHLPEFKWLGIFLLGAYFFSSLNPNKDDRYVLPYLPVLSILLAYGLTRIRSVWGKPIRWGTLGLATILMLFNLFPIGGIPGNFLTQNLSAKVQHYPYTGKEFPHPEVIEQIVQTEPYLRSTLGVLPSTSVVNQHSLNYYGALKNFQVYGRQVGTRESFVEQDARSLSWFLTKTGNQGSVPKAQTAIVQIVETGGDFELNKTWELPDNSTIKLFYQKTPSVEVGVVDDAPPSSQVTLTQVKVPASTPPGLPVPITYEWRGSWSALKNGLVLLNWENITSNLTPKNSTPEDLNSKDSTSKDSTSINKNATNKNPLNQSTLWLHDRGIGMGRLKSNDVGRSQSKLFQVTERLAMLPPKNTVPGNYTLKANYLNRISGETYEIPVPKVTLEINPEAIATPAPELDLLTQLRELGATMPEGVEALEKVFDEVGRINQYDPIQDYLLQARQILTYRLENTTQTKTSQYRDWAYTLALTNVLQRRVDDAIASLEKVIQLDPENPYAYAYLAFVQLYDWRGAAAEKSLEPALVKNPEIMEIKALSGVAALMQGNVIKAWQILSKLYL
ncbi:glycosyltransferase family 39 protein [Mastigocoleus testarum]|uniref:Glycosyl transferase n=1 Tax=Mastigocoleus testarum BC008 TaxID=371196 RepID=A0A0V7ZCY6_9CYAN|nr:glycosyltransferase family 39 protein [Mastigocoleus testarum]KST62378.1 glycosyl transferase [Mastigocoleus testarum BC008]